MSILAAAVSSALARLRAALVAATSGEHRAAVSAHMDAARDHVLAALAAAGFGARRSPP